MACDYERGFWPIKKDNLKDRVYLYIIVSFIGVVFDSDYKQELPTNRQSTTETSTIH